MSDSDTIISLIEQGQIDPVKKPLSTSPPTNGDDIIMLLRASISAMNLEIMRYLLDTYKPDRESALFRDKVLLESTGRGKTEAFKILSVYRPSILTWHLSHCGDALGHAVLADNFPLASFILDEAGRDPNQSQLAYRPPIEFAAYFGRYEMVELLLKHGAQINGTGALYKAMQSGSVDMLSFLTSKNGVDINMVQPVEETADGREITPGPVLHLAAQTRNKKMVCFLVKKLGADPLVRVHWQCCYP